MHIYSYKQNTTILVFNFINWKYKRQVVKLKTIFLYTQSIDIKLVNQPKKHFKGGQTQFKD